MKADVILDAKGLACPMPIVRTKKKMQELTDGQILEVMATDKGSKADLEAWSKSAGHQYIGTVEVGDVLHHYVRKCSNDNLVEKVFEQVIDLEQLAQLNNPFILDVREEVEYSFGHIKGAKSIPMGELESRLHELPTDETIYVICRTGKRSDFAAQTLNEKGFNKVFNVVPGMSSYTGLVEKLVK